MSSSSSKSSPDRGRLLPEPPGIGGSGGTVSGAPGAGAAGRAPAGVDGGTRGGAIDPGGGAPTSRSPVAVGAAAAVGASGVPGERCDRPEVKAPAAEVPAGTCATPVSLRLLGRPLLN